MKFGVVNKSTILNRFVFHTLQRNITHLAVITRETNIKLAILKGGGELEKSQHFLCSFCASRKFHSFNFGCVVSDERNWHLR